MHVAGKETKAKAVEEMDGSSVDRQKHDRQHVRQEHGYAWLQHLSWLHTTCTAPHSGCAPGVLMCSKKTTSFWKSEPKKAVTSLYRDISSSSSTTTTLCLLPKVWPGVAS